MTSPSGHARRKTVARSGEADPFTTVTPRSVAISTTRHCCSPFVGHPTCCQSCVRFVGSPREPTLDDGTEAHAANETAPARHDALYFTLHRPLSLPFFRDQPQLSEHGLAKIEVLSVCARSLLE